MSLASLAQRLGHRRWFAHLGRLLVPADLLVGRLTHGRVVALGLLPSLLLTTTGRRTGRPRTTPLLYARDGDGIIVIGSNWGQRHHPAWTGNLLADPRASVRIRGRHIPVTATLTTGDERDRLRGLLLGVWPAYETYERRAAGRRLRIFRLDRRMGDRLPRTCQARGGHEPPTPRGPTMDPPGTADREGKAMRTQRWAGPTRR